LDVDPLSLAVLTTAGVVLYEARRYDQALKRLVDTVEMDPGFALAQYHLGRVLAGLGEFERAIAPLEAAAPAFDGALGFLGAAYARTGRRDKAAAVRRELERRSGERYVGQLAHFTLHSGTQEIDAAIEWLERSLDARDGMVPFIGVDTAFDGLRSDPRFGAMLERLGLPA
jgi:tetratricopeptide (TPR) repeat protein